MKLAEFFVQLGVKADNQTLKNFSGGVKALRRELIGVQVAFAGAIFGLDRFVNGSLNGVVALKNLNKQTGLSIKELQKWQQAGQLSNLSLSADQIAQSIGNLEQNLSAIRMGQGNIAPFQLLGIDVAGKNAFAVLDQLRDIIKNIDPATATNLLGQLGLSPEFINVLKISRKEFQELGENTFLNKRQQDDIDDLGTTIKMLTLRFKALKDQAVAKIAPELNALIKNFFKWLKDNGDKVINTISTVANIFSSFVSAIGGAVGLMTSFIEKTLGVENGIKSISIAVGLLTASFAPFLTGLLLFIALLDDIRVWQTGGESLFGDFYNTLNKIPNLKEILGGAALLAFLAKFNGLLKVPTISLGLFGQKMKLLKAVGLLTAGMGGSGLMQMGEDSKIKDYLSSILGGAGAGAAIGSLIPFFGTAIGAGAGAVGGLGMQIFRDVTGESTNSTTNNININVTGENSRETAIAIEQQLKNTQSLINNQGY